MTRFIKTLLVLIFIYLCFGKIYLYGQEKQDAREQARQHYQQGKEFYSQGRYEEATTEFEKAVMLVTEAEILFQEKIQKEHGKVFVPKSSQEATIGFETAATLETPEILFQEKIQREERKVLAPPAALPKEALPKKKLVEKKKEEKEAEITKVAVAPEPEPETEEIAEREYYIDIGDVLDISVCQIGDLSRPEVIVRPDGKVSFPLIGDIKAEGLTLTQLDNIITERLKTYVKTPEVSIMIRGFGERTNKVVILGEIISPGIYKFGAPPTIADAVASAGGYTKYAVLNSIMVIRSPLGAKPEVTRVNFAQIIKSGKLSQNIVLRPNDIVYVPRSFIAKVNTFLEIFQPAISEYMQTLNARYLHNLVREQ